MELSYSQNLEDYHLSLAFAGQTTGTYIDVGAGHPIADNVSFWFYERGWNGIVVKAGTPSDRIKLLSEHIKRALDAPDVIERIAKLGADVAPSTPEEFGAFMRAEDKQWGDLVRKADLKIE